MSPHEAQELPEFPTIKCVNKPDKFFGQAISELRGVSHRSMVLHNFTCSPT